MRMPSCCSFDATTETSFADSGKAEVKSRLWCAGGFESLNLFVQTGRTKTACRGIDRHDRG